jgi:hypothetical protein
MNNGWQQMGTFSSQMPPVDISVSPASGTGSNQIFQFTASAAAGWQDIGTFQIIFNSTLTAVNGCYLYYTPATNLLAIANDQNTACSLDRTLVTMAAWATTSARSMWKRLPSQVPETRACSRFTSTF